MKRINNSQKHTSLKPTSWNQSSQKAWENLICKMATNLNLGKELMEVLRRSDYCTYVDLFPRNQPMTTKDLSDFRKRTVGKYIAKTAPFYSQKGKTIPDRIYSLFGKYNAISATETCENLVEWAREHRTEVTEAGTVMFAHDCKDFPWWILTTTHKTNPVDELSLWCLCKMYYRHAVVYTLDHTWTMLKDKSLSVAEIDKVCDLHLAYLGYGKFASITPRDETVNTTEVQPTIKTLTTKKASPVAAPIQPIARVRHGQHPSRTMSAHIEYFTLNKGHIIAKKKSLKQRKCKNTTELTLREPSESRIAAQKYIILEKYKQQSEREKKTAEPESTDPEVAIVATLPPDKDGTAFQCPPHVPLPILGTAIKIE